MTIAPPNRDEVVAAIEDERAHYARRHERAQALVDGLRRDSHEEADYADGVRAGLDLALSILQRGEA